MKPIYYILSILALTLAACNSDVDEPSTVRFETGKIPLALRPVMDYSRGVVPGISEIPQSIDGSQFYNIYVCAAYNYETRNTRFYYTKTGKEYFKPMKYVLATNDETSDRFPVYYVEGCFYPPNGTLTLACYGEERPAQIPGEPEVTRANRLIPTVVPDSLTEENKELRHLVLDLTNYDGTYDVIAADRIFVEGSRTINIGDLQFGHFHHIFAYIKFKVIWDSSAPADFVSKVLVNSIRVEHTPYQGIFHVGDHVDFFNTYPTDTYFSHWTDLGEDAVVSHPEEDRHVDFTNGQLFGGTYIIPQASRQRLIVNYSIINGTGANQTVRTMNYVVRDDETLKWEPGHRYFYTIKIGKTGDVKIVNVDDTNVEVKFFETGTTGNTIIK